MDFAIYRRRATGSRVASGAALRPLAYAGLGILVWVFIASTLVYQFRNSWSVGIGDYYDTPFLQTGFSDREKIVDSQRSFRWTDGNARLYAPRIGRGAWTLTMNAATLHPDGSAVEARLIFPGGTTLALPDSIEPRVFAAYVPESAVTAGDFNLEIASNIYQETTTSARKLGIPIFGIAMSPAGSRPLIAPSWSIIFIGLIGLGLLATLIVAGLRTEIATGISLILTSGLMIPLINTRIPYSFWLSSLAVFVWISFILVAGLRWLVPRLMRLGGIELDEASLNILLVLFSVGMWIKGAGLLYPYMIAIDIHWHMGKVREILNGGLGEMYKPGAFNESVMPASEWGDERPTIPYSPFFHIFATIFSIFPWQLETSTKIFNSYIDLSRIFFIYYFARSFGASRRAGLLGAATYLVLPVTYLLQSWGNVPTAFGLWWILLSSAVIVGVWERLNSWRGVLTVAAVLVPTLLFYTVTGVFMGLILISWISAIALFRRTERRQALGLLSATLLGTGAAIGIYYWQFIADIVRKTLPYFGQTLTEGQASVGATPFEESWSHYLVTYIERLWNYGLLVPLVLLPLGWWLITRKQPHTEAAKRWLAPYWMGIMLLIGIIFIPLGRSIPMVDKHLFLQIPVLTMSTGVVFDWILTQTKTASSAKTIVRFSIAAIYIIVFIIALDLWIYRIGNVKQEW